MRSISTSDFCHAPNPWEPTTTRADPGCRIAPVNAPHLPAKLSIRRPRPIFVAALLELILIVVGEPILRWLNFPSYILWSVVVVFAVYVFGSIAVRAFARDSS